ncbi:KV6AB protein, partial [Polyodon spathula]|nr:KV6AB protein [Polyodon spathula]
MYWYQQTRKGALDLIGYEFGTISHEEKFKERFQMSGKATEKGFLTISNITAEDSAVYFCAASIHNLNGIKIVQSPPSLFASPGHSAGLQCYHGDTNYDRMYWYQQTRKGALELIGYEFVTISHEDKFKERFQMSGKATEKGFLTISNITAEDSAVYICAASKHSAADPLSPLQ